MADSKISALTSYSNPDPVNDSIPIVDNTNSTTKKISRNNLLGITSTPVGINDIQTLTQKTLTSPTVNGATLSGTLSGTYTIGGTPTFPASVVTLTATQTLTNKTITSPTITGGTIDNSTVTVDSISGHTSATTVTVANLQIVNGVLNTAGAVTSTSVADGAIQPKALVTGTGSGWAWQTWSPTLTNITVGNGTQLAKYIQIGKTVFFIYRFTLGSTSALGSTPTITFPITTISSYVVNDQLGVGTAAAAGIQYLATAQWRSTTTFGPGIWNAAGTYVGPINSPTASTPNTWTTNDFLSLQGFYEAA